MHRRVIALISSVIAVGALAIGPATSASAATVGQVMNLHRSTPAVTDTTIDVGWNAVKGAFGYELQYGMVGPGSNYPATVTQSGTHYEATSLSPGTSYAFRVAAEDVAGNLGPWSNILTIQTTSGCTVVYSRASFQTAATGSGQVMNLHQSAPAPTDTTIDVGWNKVNGAQLYQVDFTSGGNSTSSVQQSGTHFHATGLSPGTAYSIQVEAQFPGANGGEPTFGPHSDILTITTPGEPCQAQA